MFYRTSKSIRFKFTFIFTTFVIAILCLFSMILYTLHIHQIRQSIEKSLVFAIEQSRQSFFDQHGKFHMHEQSDANDISQFIAIQIYHQEELLYSSHHISQLKKPYLINQYTEVENGKFLTLAKSFVNFSKKDSIEYIICGFYLQTSEKEKLHDFIFTLFFLVGICIFCSAIGSWYLAFKLLLPFRQIAQNASRISVENLNDRLQYTIENDEVGQLSLTLNDLFSRLQNSFESLKKFTSNASHELKTPLTVMQGDIEVLLRRKRSPEEYEKTLFCTIGEISRMHRLIQGLLLLAQVEGEKTPEHLEQIALVDIIETTENKLAKIYQNDQIEIQKNSSDDIYICGNPIWIEQIIENLLNNAFQNTPKNGNICISLTKSKDYAKLQIKNSGEGIAQKHIPFIFDRFYRTKNHKYNRGFGLGLAICKALVEKHNGNIEVTSIPHKETIFTICLPLA